MRTQIVTALAVIATLAAALADGDKPAYKAPPPPSPKVCKWPAKVSAEFSPDAIMAIGASLTGQVVNAMNVGDMNTIIANAQKHRQALIELQAVMDDANKRYCK